MTLKLATYEDLPEIVDMVMSFISLSPYKDFDHPREKVEEVVHSLLRDKNKGIVVMYLVNDKPVGILGGVANEMVFSREIITAELFWWVDPAHRGRKSLALKEAFEYWSKRIGAKYIQMSGLNDPKTARYYERTGYKLTENAYLKVIGA